MVTRKLKSFALLSFLAVSSWAANDVADMVVVDSADGTSKMYVMGDTKMKFTDTGMQVLSGNASDTYAYSDLKRMSFKFDVDVSGVESVAAAQLGCYPNPCREVLYVRGWDGVPADVLIYSQNGSLCSEIKGWKGDPISVENLAQGYYIIKINKFTSKFYKL